MNWHNYPWKIAGGCKIDATDGVVRTGDERDMATCHFYHAFSGDELVLCKPNVRCRIAIYDRFYDEKYIYTYDYQEEESWTTYRELLEEAVTCEKPYTFREEVYFRLWLTAEANCADVNGEECVFWKHKELRCPQVGNGLYEKELQDTVAKVQKLRTCHSLTMVLMTDTHYVVNGTWDATVENVSALTEQIKPDGIIHLGDMTDGMRPKEITVDYVNHVKQDLLNCHENLYCVMGNHDYNYFRGNPERFTREEAAALYLSDLPECVVRQRDKNYYYADYEEESLRLIFLESFHPAEQVRYGYSEELLDWLEVVLAETKAEYCVAVFSHVPPVARLHYWSDEIRGSSRLIRILKQYQRSSGGHLLGFIHGHNHADQTDMQEGFPIISIGCGKCEYFTEKKPDGSVTYKRTPNTVSQDLWDVITISAEERRIDLTRFGAGEDRKIQLPLEGERSMQEKQMRKVITYGTFDGFHEGHYQLLKRAKQLGDYLIVGITTEHYDEQRGKFNVVDSLMDRIEHVQQTGFADEIIIEDREGQKVGDIQKYQVDVFAIGSEWTGSYDYLKNYCQVVYLERTTAVSGRDRQGRRIPIVRMGIVGTGRIAPRFLAEAKFVSGLNMQSVYNPHADSVRAFAEEHQLEGYSASYEEFLESVDAVYIASPHETHYSYAKRALQRGKHVLCEKPLVFKKREAKELFSLAEQQKCVLMEGIKTAYCPGFIQLLNIARSGKIGEIRDVEACFSRLTAPEKREMTDTEYGGAFMEFGSYTVLPIIKLLGMDYQDVSVHSIPAENGIDLYTKVQFRYAKGMATSKTGLGVKSEGQLLISGTKGYILAESPWWLTRKFQVRYEDPNKIETYSPKFIGDGLRYEISEFVSRIHKTAGVVYKLTNEESIAMADVVERFLKKRCEEKEELHQRNRNAGVKIGAHRG